MSRLAAPTAPVARHLGTIVGLLIGIALIVAAILIDGNDAARPRAGTLSSPAPDRAAAKPYGGNP